MQNSSKIPSFTEAPLGWERSRIRRILDEELFCTAPSGEQCDVVNGGEVKGPEVWPREISICIASETFVLWVVADDRFLGIVDETCPAYMRSKPLVKPLRMNSTRSLSGCDWRYCARTTTFTGDIMPDGSVCGKSL